jgi:transposase
MPGHRLSDQLRRSIIYWRYGLNKDIKEISELADCAKSTIHEILRTHREYGQVNNPHAQHPGRPRSLNIQAINYISSSLEANPALYLDEIQNKLLETFDIDVSIATISRCICRLALTHKKVATTAQERNELLRATWQAAYGDIPMEYFVWLDEASVDDRTNQRHVGWASLGRACVRRATFLRGQRFSVLPALSFEGIVALDIFEGSVTKEKFTTFVLQQLV